MKQARLRGHVGEGAVAVVTVEPILAVVGEEEILPSVVVVVAHANALRPAGIAEARLGRNIGKRAVSIVVVEPVARAGRTSGQRASAKNEDIHPAVVVVVEECATRRH